MDICSTVQQKSQEVVYETEQIVNYLIVHLNVAKKDHNSASSSQTASALQSSQMLPPATLPLDLWNVTSDSGRI